MQALWTEVVIQDEVVLYAWQVGWWILDWICIQKQLDSQSYKILGQGLNLQNTVRQD